jgi:tRNA-binding protein
MVRDDDPRSGSSRVAVARRAARGPAPAAPLDANEERPVNQFKPAVVKASVSVADVERLDVRVGTILAVENVPASSKLVKLVVNFGDHERSILAGMKTERADPQEIRGRQALFVVNLEPKRMAGELSEGMLFDIGYADGLTPVLAVPERAVPDGARAG